MQAVSLLASRVCALSATSSSFSSFSSSSPSSFSSSFLFLFLFFTQEPWLTWGSQQFSYLRFPQYSVPLSPYLVKLSFLLVEIKPKEVALPPS